MRNDWLILGALSLALTALSGGAYAANPDHVRQLLTTGDCPECDLSEVAIQDVVLQDANLQGANLSGSHLQNVDLTRANLSSANLSGIRFAGANLTGANLQDADLSNAITPFFCGTSPYGEPVDPELCLYEFLPFQVMYGFCTENPELAESARAWFDDSDIEAICEEDTLADLLVYSSIDRISSPLMIKPLLLRGANLSGANLQDAVFSSADFSYATLADTEASGADFSYVRLFNADVMGLVNADLTNAWDSWESLDRWMVAAGGRTERIKAERSARSEGRTYIGSMNRAQQAYYLEEESFSTEIPFLGLGIQAETNHYRYGIVDDESTLLARRVVQYALSKGEISPSYLGVVFVEFNANAEAVRTYSTLCESVGAGTISPEDIAAIALPDDLSRCPSGWNLLP